jgi:hypothetical protein
LADRSEITGIWIWFCEAHGLPRSAAAAVVDDILWGRRHVLLGWSKIFQLNKLNSWASLLKSKKICKILVTKV